MYQPPKEKTAELRKFLRNFKYEYDSAPQEASDYQLTQSGFTKKLEEHRLSVLNRHRREAMRLRDNFEYLGKQIESKEKTVFYPKSNGFNEVEKQTALMQRQLAITELASGKINKDAMLKQIEADFKAGNVDANAARYEYLLSHSSGDLQTQFSLIGKLKEGFNSRGLSDLKSMKEDYSQGQAELSEIKKTFQLG